MLATTHVVFGILAGLLSLRFLGEVNSVIFFSMIIVGSILPDVDHHGSLLNRLFPLTRFVPVFFKHRGVFHSLFPVLALSLFLFSFPNYIVPLVIGYLSHLFSDCFTKMGVNFLYPLSNFRIQGPARTGGVVEFVLMLVVVVFCVLIWFSL